MADAAASGAKPKAAAKKGTKQGCCGRQESETATRTVVVNEADPHFEYAPNGTSTTKYNLATFLPKALFEQYRRVANIYFTLVAGLSLTPYTPVRAWTTWTPLALVLGVSLVKEGIEDYKRYKADLEINNRKVEVLNPKTQQYDERTWKDVRVGDIVVVRKDEFIPADLIFLTSESEEGTCYIETMNLDGETNLKIKKALDETNVLTHESLATFKGSIQCEPPNVSLYTFTGNMELDPPLVPQPKVLPLSPSAVLLRGCSLRNTACIHGAVIYAGHDSKVMMNATQPPSKRSRIELTVDKIILFMFTLLFSMCVTGAVYASWWTQNKMDDLWYMRPDDTVAQYNPKKPAIVGITDFITNFILYGYLIPISLYISIEIVKIVQAMVFIAYDREMYHAETDTPALARTSNLNEELGMVNTVLTDKTGTLTCNVMEYFKCSIAGVSYGAGVTEIERANAVRKGVQLVEQNDADAPAFQERFFNFYDHRLMGTAWSSVPDPATTEMFFRLLAVCHTVIPDGPPDEATIKYECESPDEAALVVAAKVFGFFFFKRTNTSVFVRERTAAGTVDMEYQVLNVLEFNSTRKRMSVIIRDPKGRIIVFCKGADTVIYERLAHGHAQNKSYKELTTQHMEEYGSGGLRTLCLAYTEVAPAAYEAWQAQYFEAKTSLQDRENKLTAVAELIEKDLRLLGCTAIEDKLQDGVPLAIKQLAQAGIRIWVLTGDKQETAINIGYACSLITEVMQQHIVSGSSKEAEALEEAGDKLGAAKLESAQVEARLQQIEEAMNKGGEEQEHALIIDGKALSYALAEKLRAKMLAVGLRCESVVCCRVSPLQKALVTALVRSHGDTTLAIGDGANDVGMILKAHIGVGISGQEGMQAVMSADFAIAQFRFLVPLLLVHGRYSYKRITRMVNFFFYKNLMFGISIFTFNAFTAFSGQYVYNDFYMTLYNVVFTSILPLVIGIFDRDMDRQWALKFPGIYKQGQRNEYFSFKAIVGWMFTSLYQVTVLVSFVLYGCRSTMVDRANGAAITMYQTGIIMFSVILLTIHLQMYTVMEQWTWVHHFACIGSTAVWWLFLLAYGAFPISLSADLYNLLLGVVAPTAQYWLYLILVPIACVLPDFFFRTCRRHLFPADHEIVQEIQAAHYRHHPPGAHDHKHTHQHTTEDGDGQQKQQRTGVDTEAGLGGEGQAAPAGGQRSVIKRIFESHKAQHSGFVPPYSKEAKPWKFLPSERAVAPVDGSPVGLEGVNGQGQAPLPQQPQISYPELAQNPMRQRLASPLGSVSPQGYGKQAPEPQGSGVSESNSSIPLPGPLVTSVSARKALPPVAVNRLSGAAIVASGAGSPKSSLGSLQLPAIAAAVPPGQIASPAASRNGLSSGNGTDSPHDGNGHAGYRGSGSPLDPAGTGVDVGGPIDREMLNVYSAAL